MQHSVTAGTTEVDVDATLGLDASSQHAQHSNAPLSEAEVAAKVNGFGLSLLGAVHKASNESNVFISPFSLVSTLGLAALGATPGGAAQRELWGALMLETGEAASFFDGLRSISDRLMVAGDVDLLNANSVWSKGSIKESFIGKAHKTLDAEAKPLPTDPAPINAWVKEATNGMIPSIIDRIDPLTVAILVNAIYFKGEWTTKFDRARSVLGSFSLSDKDRRPCAMMRRDDKRMLYAEKNDLQVVELPYGEGDVVATVLLPRQAGAVSLPALVQHSKDIGAAGLQNLLDRLAPTHVSLQLPRFNLEYGVKDLTPELESSFGIHKALYGRGEFAAMSNDSDVHLSAVLHKAKVEVNEEGTKAAAATAGIMNTRPIIMPQKEVIVDRPFLFLIRDRPTGLLLFAGAVERPELDTNL
jgi:serpin B